MANLYSRETVLKNITGRSKYISTEKETKKEYQKERIVLHEKNMKHTWEEYAQYEKTHQKTANKNNEGRETVIALPNELANDTKKLKIFCDDLAKSLYGINRDYEYAVHWNEKRNNLHVHYIYSEREINSKATPKVYKKDLWVDPKTGKACKKDTPQAILRCKKGDIQKDKEGNIKYNTDPFTTKDRKFIGKKWLIDSKKQIQEVFKKYNFEIGIFDKSKGFIPQKKLYKGAREDYKEWANLWNEKAKNHNKVLAQLKEKEKNLKKYVKANNFVKKYDIEHSKALKRQRELQDKGFIGKILYKLFDKKYDDRLLDSYDRAFDNSIKYFDNNFRGEVNYVEIAKSEYKKLENELNEFKEFMYEKIPNTKSLTEYKAKELEKKKSEEKEYYIEQDYYEYDEIENNRDYINQRTSYFHNFNFKSDVKTPTQEEIDRKEKEYQKKWLKEKGLNPEIVNFKLYLDDEPEIKKDKKENKSRDDDWDLER